MPFYKVSFPVNLSSLSVTNDSLNKYYAHIEEEFAGGYYPIGANALWHGGTHILLPLDKTLGLHAVADGKIVGVRLDQDATNSRGKFGRLNFIITEHEFSGKRYFSLFMHLLSMNKKDDLDFLKTIPWLNTKETSQEKWFVNTKSSSLNFRKSASEDAEKVIEAGLPKESEVRILTNPAGTAKEWQRVQAQGVTGYVKSDFLEKRVVTT